MLIDIWLLHIVVYKTTIVLVHRHMGLCWTYTVGVAHMSLYYVVVYICQWIQSNCFSSSLASFHTFKSGSC